MPTEYYKQRQREIAKIKKLFDEAAKEDVEYDLNHYRLRYDTIVEHRDKDFFTFPVFEYVNKNKDREYIVPMRIINKIESYAKSLIIMKMQLKKLAVRDVSDLHIVDDNYEILTGNISRDEVTLENLYDRGIDYILEDNRSREGHDDDFQAKTFDRLSREYVNN